MPATVYAVGELVTAAKLNKSILYRLWDSIDAGVTLPTNSITTPTLDSSFAHLLVVAEGRCSDAGTSAAMAFRINGDNAAHYYQQNLLVNNATVTGLATVGASAGSLGNWGAAGASASVSGGSMLLLPAYSLSTFFQTWLMLNGDNTTFLAAGMQSNWGSGVWSAAAPAALTTLTFYDSSGGNITAGSRITVYGL